MTILFFFHSALFCIAGLTDSDQFVPKEPTRKSEVYGQDVRETEHCSPDVERQGFHLPDGFEIDLIASEPTIAKPMNLAFDDQGRLWVTHSSHYPYPRKADADGLDGIVVFEDRDKNGSFETSRVFADKLNIPIGILPYRNGALCFSIPNILFLQDTDGDGVCDRREVVLGPFDTSRDTHGMVNSLRMGSDGWVYACHGFNNQSEVAGRDGNSIKMISGNVFRFLPDGTRVEQYTIGQVNPFGMAQDRFGYWYAADCHSKPISQLIHGGCYPSFSRPDDGLGFVPPMMNHLHGSTAIAGLAHSKDSRFPISMQDNFFSGNVMTSRINRNRIEYHGATAKAIEMPDLLTSEDPWFRPVDLVFGPDGHLYVADFYNKIIGHYEVALEHPGRDRRSGRIWRIRWTGSNALSPSTQPNLAASEIAWSRLSASDIESTIRSLDSFIAASARPANRLLNSKDVDSLISLYKALNANDQKASIAKQKLLEAISRGDVDTAEKRATFLLKTSAEIDFGKDPILNQTLLISLRRILLDLYKYDETRVASWIDATCISFVNSNPKPNSSLNSKELRALIQVLLGMKTSTAITGILNLLEKCTPSDGLTDLERQIIESQLLRLSETLDDANAAKFVSLLKRVSTNTENLVDQVLAIGQRQTQQKGKASSVLLREAHMAVAQMAFDWLGQSNHTRAGKELLLGWHGRSMRGEEKRWGTEARQLPKTVGNASSTGVFYSSFPLRESFTGTWTSAPFSAPDQLRFCVVGHNGLPGQPIQNKNYVALIRLDDSGNEMEEIARIAPPRSDIGKWVEVDLSKVRGNSIIVRVVDGDAAASYAWIGVGQFDVESLNPNEHRKQFDKISALVETFGWPTQDKEHAALDQVLTSPLADWTSRKNLNRFRGNDAHPVQPVMDIIGENRWFDLLSMLGRDFSKIEAWNWKSLSDEQVQAFAGMCCRRCSFKEQERLVLQWSRQNESARLMSYLLEKGALSRDALRVLPASYWEANAAKPDRQSLLTYRPEATAPSIRMSVVESKADAISKLQPDLAQGAKLFEDRCAVCHKLGNLGKVIGPQLDGIGSRGVARLCEDILWPDRNVDEAFRMTLMTLAGGESVNGLVSDRTQESLMLTDQTGKQRRILSSEIEQEKKSKLSLMPGNFEETMSNQDLASLVGYLRKQTVRAP